MKFIIRFKSRLFNIYDINLFVLIGQPYCD